MADLNILEQKENKLFNRKEIVAEIEADVTPSNTEVETLVTEKLSAQPESVKIKQILGKFGSHTFKVIANVYDTKEDKERIEPKVKQKKGAAQ
jgi:ribosomal protein S24E